MTTPFGKSWSSKGVVKYLRVLDDLRERRRAADWTAEQDRPILAELEEIYATLSEDEQEEVEDLSWRGWPEMFDERAHAMLCLCCGLRLHGVMRSGHTGDPPNDGTVWICGGTYGTRVYDPCDEGQYLEAYVCDGCLQRHQERVYSVCKTGKRDRIFKAGIHEFPPTAAVQARVAEAGAMFREVLTEEQQESFHRAAADGETEQCEE